MSKSVTLADAEIAAASSRRPADGGPANGIGEFGWIWLATVALFAASGVMAPATLAPSALLGMLPFAGVLAIVAVGQTLVVQQRGLDMSAAGMVSLAGILSAVIGYATGSVTLGVFAALAAALGTGAINGLLSARMNIMPLVATLAVNALLIGAVRSITGNAPVTAPPGMQAFSHGSLAGLPYSLWLAVLFIALLATATKRTVVGRRFVAVGVNPRAAAAAGVAVLRYQIGTYALSALCFAVAGMLLAGYVGNASHTGGNDYVLPAIAAVVLGGTPFTGGRGSVVASGIAALFMAQLSQLVLALGAGPALQLLATALAVLLATTIRLLPRMANSLSRSRLSPTGST